MDPDKSISSIEQHFSTVSMEVEADIEASESLAIAEMNFEVTSGQLELGFYYYNSLSVENNCEKAFKFISRSAEQGNAGAQFMLGNLYALGHGTEKNHEKAYVWYTKSAIQGYKKALIRIHNLYQEDVAVHCRGQLNSEEDEWNTDEFKKANNVRELNEYRLKLMKPLLNGAMDYYTNQFKKHQSAKEDDPEAQQTLGFLYQHGYGVKKITRWAIECYTIAAEQGFIDAQYNLACLYQKNTDIKFNYRKAFHWYSKAAKQGQNMAQMHLAYLYEKGLSTDVNPEIAIFWYVKAATTGNPEAQLTLGKIYRKGQYVKQTYTEASRWYLLAARQGSCVAQNCLVQLNQSIKSANFISDNESKQDNFVKSVTKKSLCSKLRMDICLLVDQVKTKEIQTLAMHAFKGDGNSMYQIGLKYYYGNDFQRDIQAGFKWIKNAAKAGIAEAQEMLVKNFEGGEVVDQNYHKMHVWTKFGLKKNKSKFLYRLGMLYTKGHGVRYDPLEASKWFTISATYENSDAQCQLGLLKYSGQVLRQDLGEAYRWFYRSALQRNTNGLYELGKNLFYGITVEQDIQRSLRLFEYAATHGNVKAQLQLGKVFEKGVNVSRDIQKATRFYNMLADSNNGYGQYVLALKYLKGEIFNQNYEKAFFLFKSAAEKGCFEAKSLFNIPLLQRISALDYSLVLKMFISVSKNGTSSMGFNVGLTYEHGMKISGGKYLIEKNYEAANTWYRVAAQEGDPRAMYRLGIIYDEGKEGNRDLRLAISYYQDAYKRGEVGATYRLACIYLEGRGVEKDLVRAFNLFTEASHMGHQEARKVLLLLEYNDDNDETINNCYGQEDPVKFHSINRILMLENMAAYFYAGFQYILGQLYEKNGNTESVKWYHLASQKGISDAFFRLGRIYEKNELVPADYSVAISYYEKATQSDHGQALFRLAQMYCYGIGTGCNYLKAHQLYAEAAGLGHDSACKLLSIFDQSIAFKSLEQIKEFLTVSSEELQHVFKMFELEAEHGNTDLQCKLGCFYEFQSEFSKAFYWYSKGSNHSKNSMYHLGQLYERGLGVEQSYMKSVELYEQAKELGSIGALFKVGSAYHHGYGVKRNSETAVYYYSEAAKSGQTESQFMLGKLYETGELVGKDLLEAVKWYTRASLNGHTKSTMRLYEMYDHKPYEHYFYERLFRILSVLENSNKREDKRYYNIYGSLYFKLGRMYAEKQNSKKAFLNFSKAYNIYKNPEAEAFATLAYNDNHPNAKDDYCSKLDVYFSIMHQLDDVQQYNLGMLYYQGVTIQEEHNSLEGSVGKENMTNREENTRTVIIQKDHPMAKYYFTLSSLQKNQEARIQLIKMFLKGESKKSDQERLRYCIRGAVDD